MRALAACLLLVGVGPLLAACGRDEQAAPAAPAHSTAAVVPAAAATGSPGTGRGGADAVAAPVAAASDAPPVDCVAVWNDALPGGRGHPRVQVSAYVATRGYGCSYRVYDGQRSAVWSALLTPAGPVWPPDQGHGARLTASALAAFERWRDRAVDGSGAIRGAPLLVPREVSRLPVGSRVTADAGDDPARPARAGIDEIPVPVWRYPAARDGMAELIAGRVGLDRATGCVTLDGHPALWPTGTWVTERPFVVHLPGRVVLRDGDSLEGGGGHGPARWARELAEPSVEGRTDALDCLGSGGPVTALNATGEVRVTARSR